MKRLKPVRTAVFPLPKMSHTTEVRGEKSLHVGTSKSS
jgi:hypothetical protein